MMFRNTKPLTDRNWYAIEIGGLLEPNLGHLVRSIPDLFPHPLELFIPVDKQDGRSVTLLSGNFVFIRTSASSLQGLKKITGIRGTVGEYDQICDGFKRSDWKPIPIPDADVQPMIETCRTKWKERKIKLRQMVRVRDGHFKNLNGRVIQIKNGTATVRIKLNSHKVILHCPVANLIPTDAKTFY